MGPDDKLASDERAIHRAHKALLGVVPGERIGADTQFTYQVVPQAILATRTLVAASGSSDGGHILLRPRLMVLENGRVSHVLAESKNLDEDGYRRELTDVLLCQLGYYQGLYHGDALTTPEKLASLRKRECRSIWPELRGDARKLAPLLAMLSDNGHAARIVEKPADLDPRLQALVAGRKTSEARWVPGVKPEPPGPLAAGRGWLTVTEERTTWYQRFSLGATFTTEQLGYTVSVIE